MRNYYEISLEEVVQCGIEDRENNLPMDLKNIIKQISALGINYLEKYVAQYIKGYDLTYQEYPINDEEEQQLHSWKTLANKKILTLFKQNNKLFLGK